MRERLPRLAYSRPITVLMMGLACMVVGAIAWMGIPIQLLPAGLEPSMLYVWISYPNGSPRETDISIVQPLLEQLGTVSGVEGLYSNASPDSAGVRVEFHGATDMEEAYNAVVDRVERALPNLPADLDRYVVWKYNPDDEPIVWAGVSFDDSVQDPSALVNQIIQPRLERLQGVAGMDVYGVNSRALEVHYHRDAVYAHGVDLGELYGRLSQDNFQTPGGRVIDQGRYRNIRSMARFEGVDTLKSYPIRDGLVLSDVADVGFLERRDGTIHRVDGRRAAVLGIKKDASANTVEMAEKIEAALGDLRLDPRLQGAHVSIFFSQGEVVAQSLNALLKTAAFGGLFALIILYLFLREIRMTLLIAASIPFSMLITLGILYFRGDSLNLISLMGLMLAVGMVVDNAIVVVETIYRRFGEGLSMAEAAVKGTGEVYLAIVLSTLTTMVVFLPIILMAEDGLFATFMAALGLPVVFSLAASLLVALVFAPVSTRWISTSALHADPAWLVGLTERYTRLLRWILSRRFDAGAVIAVLAMLTVMVPMSHLSDGGKETEVADRLVVRFSVPPQAGPAERDAAVRQLERWIEGHRAEWGIRTYRASLRAGQTDGQLHLYREPGFYLDPEVFYPQVREELQDKVAGVHAEIGWVDQGELGGTESRTLRLEGAQMAVLESLASEVVRRVSSRPEVLSAYVSESSEGMDEVQLRVRSEAVAQRGLTAESVGQLVGFAMRQNGLPPIWQDGREIAVSSSFALADRSSVEAVRSFSFLSGSSGELLPVRALTDVVRDRGPSTIRRIDGVTSMEVRVDLVDGVGSTSADEAIESALSDMVYPRGYRLKQGFELDERATDDSARNLAMLLSISFVFFLMGVLFDSFILPFCVIMTIPMAMCGAFWGLYLTGTALDVMAGIGLIILMGVIVNNGIVLVDRVTQLRRSGLSRDAALIAAGQQRLRPILMTALTTISGLLPMAWGGSAVAGVSYGPLGRVVLGGLVVGTLLTLLFIPYLYAILDDVRLASRETFAFVRGGRR